MVFLGKDMVFLKIKAYEAELPVRKSIGILEGNAW
jgi:hypothetical protein